MPVSAASSLAQVGPYQIVRYLDHGPVAAAYLCRRADSADELFVLSIVHDDLSIYRWLIDQLLAEIAICARIQHPNVEAIVEFGTIQQHGYVVTRYVEGCALSQLMALPMEVPPRIGFPLIADVLRGLHAAHALSDARGPIVHSGVAPASIHVGKDGIARVTEFGIARVQMRTTQTMPGVRTERFSHLSPEQICQSGEIDVRADIFAVGTVLWSLSTGQPLFSGSDTVATMHRVLHQQAPAPSTVGRRPPSWLDPICLRALQKAAHLRYPSAEEMASALQTQAINNKCWAPRTEIAEWMDGAWAKIEAMAKADAMAKTESVLPPNLPGRSTPALSFQRVGSSDGILLSASGPKTRATGSRRRRRRMLVGLAIALFLGPVLALGGRMAIRMAAEPLISSATVLHPPPLAPEPPPPVAEGITKTQLEPGSQAAAEPAAPAPPAPAVGAHSPAVHSPPVAPPAVRPKTPAPPVNNKPPRPNTSINTPPVASILANTPPAPPVPPMPPMEASPRPLPTVESNPYLRHSR